MIKRERDSNVTDKLRRRAEYEHNTQFVDLLVVKFERFIIKFELYEL